MKTLEKENEEKFNNSQSNIEKRSKYEYKKLKEKEDINIDNYNSNVEQGKIYSTNKFDNFSGNHPKNIKSNNDNLLPQKISKESTYKIINSKLKDDSDISKKNNNIEKNMNNNSNNPEVDIKLIEIKNLNRNIKNNIKSNFKLKDKYNSSLNNISVSRYLSFDKSVKNDLNNSSDLNPINKYNYNEYSNIKSRNKIIIKKNNNDIENNINNNMNIMNNLKKNTYLYLPKVFNDFEVNAYNNYKNMTIGTGNEYCNNTINANDNLNGNKSTIIRRKDIIINNMFSKMHKNQSANNIYLSEPIKFKNDNNISYKNKNHKNNYHKIKSNFSSNLGNNRSNIGFNSSNNSFVNNNINSKNNNLYDYYNYDYIKNMQIKNNLEKLDNNINVNEKFINSPIQAYQTYQKSKKENNIKNHRPLNIFKNILFDNKNNNNYKNMNNNNYQNNIYNVKGKDAQMIQNLINNLQSNIKEYINDKNAINNKVK